MIDDFGSGSSSLGYLKRLPIDVLKIDKSFVLQMEASADDAVVVRSTIDLGHNLGLRSSRKALRRPRPAADQDRPSSRVSGRMPVYERSSAR